MLFRKKGMDGVNMRELAERAGVNKGLLHYYFKTKASILQEVVVHEIGVFYQGVNVLLHASGSLYDKVPVLVDSYFQLFDRTPGLPAFVLFEIQRDPTIMVRVGVADMLREAIAVVQPELERAKLPPERSSAMQFIMDVVGLCAFTYGTLPGVSKAMKLTKAQRTAFIQERKLHIIALIRHGLEP